MSWSDSVSDAFGSSLSKPVHSGLGETLALRSRLLTCCPCLITPGSGSGDESRTFLDTGAGFLPSINMDCLSTSKPSVFRTLPMISTIADLTGLELYNRAVTFLVGASLV